MAEVAHASLGLSLDSAALESGIARAAIFGGNQLEGIFKNAAKAATTLLPVAIGAALVDMGEKFQVAFNTIQQKTGETGAALKGLEGDFRNVFSSTPGANFQNVAAALSEVEVRTHLAGPALDTLTAKFVELGKITGTDVAGDVQQLTGLFNLFGVVAADQGRQLDVIFKASQDAGVSVAEFANSMQAAAPTAQALGLNVDQTAAIVDKLTRLGLPAQRVMMGLGMEFAKAAKAGKDPTQVIGDLVTQVQKAPNAVAALTIAMGHFGVSARQGAILVNAIRSGVFDFGATLAQITSGKGGINDTAWATMTLGDQFHLLQNKVSNALQPISAEALHLADVMMGKLIPAFDATKGWVGELVDTFEHHGLGGVVSKVAGQVETIGSAVWAKIGEWTPKIASKLGEWAVDFSGWVQDVWPVLVKKLADLYNLIWGWIGDQTPGLVKKLGDWSDAFSGWVADVWPKITKNLGGLLSSIVGWIESTLPTVEQSFGKWLDELGSWFENQFGPWMDKHFNKWGEELGRWLVDNTPTLVAKFNVFLAGLVIWMNTKFVPELLFALVVALATFQAQLTSALVEAAGSALSGALTGVTQGVLDWAAKAVNSVIDVINHIIDAYNHLPGFLKPGGTIPEISHIGGQTAPPVNPAAANAPAPGIIPKPAGGGVAMAAAGGIFLPKPGGHLVNVAEAGRAEAILPLTDRMLAALEGLGAGHSTGGITTGDIYVTSPAEKKTANSIVAELRAEAFLLGL